MPARVTGWGVAIVLACGAAASVGPTTLNGGAGVHPVGLRETVPHQWQPMEPFERMPAPVARHRARPAFFALAQAPRYRTVCPAVLQYGESAALVDPSSLGNCRDFFASLNYMVWGAF